MILQVFGWALAGIFGLGIIIVMYSFLYSVCLPTVTRRARVVGKRTEESEGIYHLCLFEFEGGERTEYRVGEGAYTLAVLGESVEVDTRGSLFWGLRRVAE